MYTPSGSPQKKHIFWFFEYFLSIVNLAQLKFIKNAAWKLE